MEHRSNPHSYTVRMKKRNMTATVIVVLLSVALIAGIIVLSPVGDYLSEHVFGTLIGNLTSDKHADRDIVAALKSNESSASPSPTKTASPQPVQNSINIIETPFYILQMGAFTESSDANTHAQKLRAMGAGGMVYTDGSVYRVFAAAYRDEESLKKVQSQVRSDGFEATPYITEQNSVHLSLKGDPSSVKAIEDAVMLLSEIPCKLCDLSLQFDKETIDGINLKDALKELLDEIETSMASFAAINSESLEPLKQIYQIYQNHISTFLEEHDTISKMNAGELKHLQLECITDYIQFFERK